MSPLGFICADCYGWWERDPSGQEMDFFRCPDCDGPVGPVALYRKNIP